MLPEELHAIREIFELSAERQVWASTAERERFFATWTGYYFRYCPEQILLDRSDGKIQGYLMGCFDSAAASVFYQERVKSYALFHDLFKRFPAHFHMNVHPRARSQGVGAKLIARFVQRLREFSVPGVHIVTSLESRNQVFYRRNGFTFEESREWNQYRLLFMGQTL